MLPDIVCELALGSELLETVLPNGGIVVMIQAYFDESGTHLGSPRMCVAGYLIDSVQAKKMNEEWAETLKRFGISRFHMQECAHGIGEFKLLSKLDRSGIAQSLIELVKLRAEVGIAVSMCEQEFEAAKTSDWRGGAYTLCAQWSMQAVKAWTDKYAYNGPVAYFFEAGHRCQPEMEGFMRMAATHPDLKRLSRYDSHSFVSKGRLAGLDAADLLAWKWNKEYLNTTGHGGKRRRHRRLSLQNLLGKTHIACHWTKDQLNSFFGTFVRFRDQAQFEAMPEELRRFGREKPNRS